MRILWFTNTPSSAATKLGKEVHTGGWLSSLEDSLSQGEGIELGIGFYSNNKLDSFTLGNTSYFPIFRGSTSSKIKRLLNRASDITERDRKEVQLLLNTIEKFKPDIIHVHGTEDNFGLIIQHTEIPVVISIQGILGPITEKFFAGVPKQITNRYEGVKLKATMKSSNVLFSNMKKRVLRERKILAHAKYIIGRTDWDKSVSQFLAPNSEYFVGNEILRKPFYERVWQQESLCKKVRIITVSSSALYKGMETIVKTAALLSTHHSFEFEWSIIGVNKEDKVVSIITDWLKTDVCKINLNFLGKKCDADILQALLNSDIYCQASHIENSSNSLCEAMLVGMPIIATYVGGTPSLLENRKEGLLVQEGDPYAIAGAIKELISEWHLAIEYGKNARAKASIRHNRKTIIDDLTSIYHSIVIQRR